MTKHCQVRFTLTGSLEQQSYEKRKFIKMILYGYFFIDFF